ncbi:uncharacterized protein [Erythrolamprus reginae]|uniref:uncharacterized protein n=1 Tax=Erythrolamprus reginae TaxID=121349 RepID=UPI00396C7FEA
MAVADTGEGDRRDEVGGVCRHHTQQMRRASHVEYLANCYNCVMESEFKRRMMHFSRNFQDEGERSNVSSTTTLIEARRRIELLTSRSHNYQFSRHQEDITTRVIHQGVACHDSCIAKYLHQDDRLTTERSLVEKKPEPHRKYTPLQNFMSSSDEALDLEKLKRENLSLRYKIKKVCGEKEEILKENNFLKEELNSSTKIAYDRGRYSTI